MKRRFFVADTRSNRRMVARGRKNNQPQKAIIILMSMPQAIHAVIGALEMPDGNADRGVRAKEVVDACEVSTYVTIAPATITAIRADITAYNGATPATRQNLYRVMHNDLKGLLATFQQAADADPANAVAILESGAFHIRHVAIQQKHEWKVTQNPVSGTVDLEAQGGPPHSCHDWWYSADGVNYTRMDPTVEAHTQKTGLPAGRPAWFIHQLITKDGPQGKSQALRIDVK